MAAKEQRRGEFTFKRQILSLPFGVPHLGGTVQLCGAHGVYYFGSICIITSLDYYYQFVQCSIVHFVRYTIILIIQSCYTVPGILSTFVSGYFSCVFGCFFIFFFPWIFGVVFSVCAYIACHHETCVYL